MKTMPEKVLFEQAVITKMIMLYCRKSIGVKPCVMIAVSFWNMQKGEA